MEIIRRNTDYALRLIIHLAGCRQGTSLSARTLAKEESVSHQLASKLLQKLHSAGIVASRLGSLGGFYLNKSLKDISLAEIVEIIQGPINVNKCILDPDACPRISSCTIRKQLLLLQKKIEDFCQNTALDRLAENRYLTDKVEVGGENKKNLGENNEKTDHRNR